MEGLYLLGGVLAFAYRVASVRLENFGTTLMSYGELLYPHHSVGHSNGHRMSESATIRAYVTTLRIQ